MSYINFDFDTVYGCEAKIRQIAELIEGEAHKLQKLIGSVETGWTGAGANEYTTYLQALYKNVLERSQKLYDIANALNGSAVAAKEADDEAARQLAAAQSQTSSQTPGASTVTQQSQQTTSSPSTTTSGNTGAARNAHTSTGSSALGAAHSAISNVIRSNSK